VADANASEADEPGPGHEDDPASGRRLRPAHPIPRLKRVFDLCAALPGLVMLLPIAVVIAILLRLTNDPGPLIYRGLRVGEGGVPFRVYKFRSMRTVTNGLGLTSAVDPRITPLGAWLRRTKLDELPQLWNVLRGEMSLVGPRPEDPKYVDWQNPVHREVFSCRPGITGPAQIQYRHEQRLLSEVDIERQYVDQVLPAKLALDVAYLRRQSVRSDLRILARTVRALAAREGT
jgi:lipopolysaccharide/colanic/teichoic acid biosynthesis glycosyltransferase